MPQTLADTLAAQKTKPGKDSEPGPRKKKPYGDPDSDLYNNEDPVFEAGFLASANSLGWSPAIRAAMEPPANLIIGTPGNDTLTGTPDEDAIQGLDGDDQLFGLGGQDKLYGGNGRDTLNGGHGNDVLFGDANDDRLYGDLGYDLMYGGNGNDEINGGDGNDMLYGDANDDRLYGDLGYDLMYGGNGNDEIKGGAGGDTLAGEDGADLLYGDLGDDTLSGGNGNDSLIGSEGINMLDGGRGDDSLSGGGGDSTAVYNRGASGSSPNPAVGIVADLRPHGDSGDGIVIEQYNSEGPSVPSITGTLGRYIRIYAHGYVFGVKRRLTLTEVRVYAGGGVAQVKSITPRGSSDDNNWEFFSGSPQALVDGKAGGFISVEKQNFLQVAGNQVGSDACIELDLGSVQAIDTIQLWGAQGSEYDCANLRVYVSPTPFSPATTYDRPLIDNPAVKWADVAQATTAGDVFYTDSLNQIQSVTGTAWADSIIGNNNNNVLSGDDGNDTMDGAAGNDTVRGGKGNDIIRGGSGMDTLETGPGADLAEGGYDNDVMRLGQDMQDRASDTLDGESGSDTLDYSGGGMAGSINANLATGRVDRILAGTYRNVGAAGRYLRIYHTDANAVLSITGMSVYAGGVDVAAGKTAKVGVDSGKVDTVQAKFFNPAALTDAAVGGPWNGGTTPATSNLAHVMVSGGAKPYIELDLGSGYPIDAISLWGRTDRPDQSNNLRVYISNTPFTGANYASLEANAAVARVEAQVVDTAATTTVTDVVRNIENIIGTQRNDTFTGDANANVITLGLGADTANAGDGNDVFKQGMDRFSDKLDGGAGTDTVDYSGNGMAGTINANLATGKITKILAGTYTHVGKTGRHLRIYHTNENPVLSITEMKVFAGGVNVAAGRAAWVGVEGGSHDTVQGQFFNPLALTNAEAGGPWNGQAGSLSNLAHVVVSAGGKSYIELDLGSVQAIDGISLWGRTDRPDQSNNLRVYISDTPFTSLASSNYAGLEANTAVARVDALVVDTAATSSITDVVSGVDSCIATDGPDNITGTTSANEIKGGKGNDIQSGGAGSDTYVFQRGDGADRVQENDATAGNMDALRLMAGIAHDQVWLSRAANDLIVSVLGEKNDKVTISNWYLGNAYHVEQIKSGDGKTLGDGNVDKLVQAMAAFTPPPPGQFTLPDNYRAVLAPVLAANWQ